MHIQSFGPSRSAALSHSPERVDFPFGFFANWGGWLSTDISRLDGLAAVGHRLHPVSPFDDPELLGRFLQRSAELNVSWDFDMRHLTADPKAMVNRVKRWKGSGAIASWCRRVLQCCRHFRRVFLLCAR